MMDDFLVPMLFDNYSEAWQHVFMMGYEYNSIVQTLLDVKVQQSSMTVYAANKERIQAMAERSDKIVDFKSTEDEHFLQLMITKKDTNAN